MCIKYPAIPPQAGTQRVPMAAALAINFGINVCVSVKVHGEEQVSLLGHLRPGLPK